RGPDPSGRAALHAVRRAPGIAVSAMVPGLIKELRRRGCVRLQAATVVESALGRALRRCGFVPRPEAVPLVALALTPLGEECVQAVEDVETVIDTDRFLPGLADAAVPEARQLLLRVLLLEPRLTEYQDAIRVRRGPADQATEVVLETVQDHGGVRHARAQLLRLR